MTTTATQKTAEQKKQKTQRRYDEEDAALEPLRVLLEQGAGALVVGHFADLAWGDNKKTNARVRRLLKNAASGKHADVFEGLRERFGLDLRAELEKSLVESAEDD